MATDVGQHIGHTDDQSAPADSFIDRRRIKRGIGGIVVFITIWWVVAAFQPPYVLPTPRNVASTFIAETVTGELPRALGQSILHWIPGTITGTVLGIATGISLGWSGRLDDFAAPVVRTLRPVPPLALIGFAIAWFGINHIGAAFIIAIGAFWINFYAAYGGIEGVQSDLLDVGRSLGVTSNVGLIRHVAIPAALPEILTGVRTGIGRCWMLVVAAEIFGVPGIGRRILRASNNLQVDVVIAYILVLSLTFLVVDIGFRAIQRQVVRWH